MHVVRDGKQKIPGDNAAGKRNNNKSSCRLDRPFTMIPKTAGVRSFYSFKAYHPGMMYLIFIGALMNELIVHAIPKTFEEMIC